MKSKLRDLIQSIGTNLSQTADWTQLGQSYVLGSCSGVGQPNQWFVPAGLGACGAGLPDLAT